MLAKRLKKGDTIGIISPSSILEDEESLETLNKTVKTMEKLGFKVVEGKYAFADETGYGTTAKHKADDINTMFANKEIKAIFSTTGGENSISTFEYIDWDTIKNNPKIICGFSDTTSLLNEINEKTGLVTFLGPSFKSISSGETDYRLKSVIDRFIYARNNLFYNEDIECYENNVIANRAEYIMKNSEKNIIENSSENNIIKGSKSNKKNETANNKENANKSLKELRIIREGKAQGKLVGGNLTLSTDLISGKYKINFKNKILLIEELAYEANPEKVSHDLYKMKQEGIFNEISGIWLGNYEGNVPIEKILIDTIDDIKFNKPIIKSNNFGHGEKKIVIPIGAEAKINTSKFPYITLQESFIN